MPGKYPHLVSPFKVGNHVFRNRLFSAPQGLHALQAGEPYPTPAMIENFANKARGGAALVTLSGISPFPVVSDGEHSAWDVSTPNGRHIVAQLAEAVHFYGAKTSMEIRGMSREPGYDVVAGLPGMDGKPSKEMTEDIMDEIADSYASQAAVSQNLGYDMCMIHMAYGAPGGARFLSPHYNTRTDEYGGSVANRSRFPIMVFDRVKQKCGKDFLIEFRMSGAEPFPDGITIEDSIELARLLEGHIDFLHVHAGTMQAAHPMGFLGDTPNLGMAEAIKKSGTALLIVTIGGNQDLDESEAIIAEGKADVISMARGWIADPDLGIKAYEGRGDDVVPCIKCMRCHDSACLDNRTYICSVNPTIGIEHRLAHIVRPPAKKKKVAVIGGGPAGMQAALVAASRGHDVTIYEKSGVLGGQLNFADHVSFKKKLSKYKNFMVYQVGKAGITVKLNTEATPELLAPAGYDEVIGALGAEPLLPGIPGIAGVNVVTAVAVYGHERELTSPVVVIGGGQVGCETGLHLALSGHQVTILEMQDKLAPDASEFYRDGMMARFGRPPLGLIGEIEADPNVDYILNACCMAIGEGVTYRDAAGAEHVLPAGSVVVAAGMKPRLDEAAAFYGCAQRYEMVGDCSCVGNLERATRTGYAAAVVL